MKNSAIYGGRLTAAAVILAGAAAVVGALTPATSQEVRPFLQALGIISCASSSPCQEGKNAGKGAGLEGISAKGNGVIGQTTFNSTSYLNGQAAVFGQDKSTSGVFNVGVIGLSTKGAGVVGSSTSNSGVFGTSSSGPGTVGISTTSAGARGNSSSGPGVDAVSSSSSGVAAFSQSGAGIFADSNSGVGAEGLSGNNIGVFAQGGSVGTILLPALSVNGNANNPDLIYACSFGIQNPCRVGNGLPSPQFAVVNNGNLIITGLLFTSGACNNGCASSRSKGEQRVRLFTPQESLPTVEDFGQAQLVGGRAYIHIDRAFAKTMDDNAVYMVFITPEGDSNGLYVINKSAGGFEARENKGGRSTLSFSYRIVAKPFGQRAARLQMITVTKPGRSSPLSRMR